MLDLLIVNSSAAHGIYGSDLAASLIAVEPPLWCRLIAGYILDKGYSVEILDAEALGLSPDETATRAAARGARLTCVAVYGHQPSASTQQMDAAIKFTQRFRVIADYRATIIVGGHVAALPKRSLAESNASYACNGEGPVTIAALLGTFKLDEVPGLVYRDAVGQICENAPAPLIPIDELGGANAWCLLDMSLYRAHNWQCFDNLSKRQPYASIHTSLGCPYKCSFCMINAPFHSNTYRMRAPWEVVDEMLELYTRYGVRTFKIVDEMFVLNVAHYTEICQLIIERGVGDRLNIWAYARVDTVKPEHLTLLRRAGVRWLALGIESASAYVRDGSNKRLKFDDIETVVNTIRAHDINVIANYIFGLPDDTLNSMVDTLDLAKRLNTEFANFYSAMAYPGSALYEMALKHNWILPNSWRGYSQHNVDCRPLDTKYIDAATVLRFRDYAFNAYFTDERYLNMIGSKFGPAAVEHIRAMTTIKLPRKLLGTA